MKVFLVKSFNLNFEFKFSKSSIDFNVKDVIYISVIDAAITLIYKDKHSRSLYISIIYKDNIFEN